MSSLLGPQKASGLKERIRRTHAKRVLFTFGVERKCWKLQLRLKEIG